MTQGLASSLTGVAVVTWVLANFCCYAANENSWVSRVLKLPPLLLVSNRCASVVAYNVFTCWQITQHARILWTCRRKFADAQPETFLLYDILDPRDLVELVAYLNNRPNNNLVRLCAADCRPGPSGSVVEVCCCCDC